MNTSAKIAFVAAAIMAVLTMCNFFTLRTKNFEIEQLKAQHSDQVKLLEHRLELADTEINALYNQLIKATSVKATITWYHPDSGGINSDSDPVHTATMTKPTVGRTIAISTSLVKRGWLGKRIYIDGYGVFVAESRMAVDLPGNRIDICAASEDIAFKNGIKHNVLCSRLIY